MTSKTRRLRKAGDAASGRRKTINIPDYSISRRSEDLGYIISAILSIAIPVIVFKVIGDAKKDDRSVVPAQAQ